MVASVDYTLRPETNSTQHMTPPASGRGKLFSDVLKNQDYKRHTVTLKPKETTTTPEQIKNQLKKQHKSD